MPGEAIWVPRNQLVSQRVEYDLGLERSHRYGAQQQPFPDGEYGRLLHTYSLERPFSDGVHEDVCRGVDEDSQAFTSL